MASPLVDTNTLIAIDSLFQPSNPSHKRSDRQPRDPWAAELAGTFSDLYIYEDSFRFTLPRPETQPSAIDINSMAPALARDLWKLDPRTVTPQVISGSDQDSLKRYYSTTTYQEWMLSCLSRFEQWAEGYRNVEYLKAWLATLRFKEIQDLWQQQIGRDYFFDLNLPALNSQLNRVAERLGLQIDDMRVSFDSVLRVPLYADKIGDGNYYLYHRQREPWLLASEPSPALSPTVPVSFAPTFQSIGSTLTREEYIILLFEIRARMRKWNVVKMTLSKRRRREMLRDLAAEVRLPPRIRGFEKAWKVGTVTLIAGGTEYLKSMAPDSSRGLIVGAAALAVASSVAVTWRGPHLPRAICKFSMLRRFLEWDMENDEDREPSNVFSSRPVNRSKSQ